MYSKLMLAVPKELPDLTFDPVPCNRVADPFGGRDPQPRLGVVSAIEPKDKKSVLNLLSDLRQEFEFRAF